MDPKINKFSTIKIILLMFIFITVSGLLFYLNRIEAFSDNFPLLGEITRQFQGWGLPYPESLSAFLYAVVISGFAVFVAGRVIGKGRQNGIIEVRLKDTETNSSFDKYLNDLKYYGSSLMPGFRSGRKVNSFISIIYFSVSLLPVLEGNYLVMAALICLPFIIFGLQGILSRKKRKVDFFIKIVILLFFTTIFGVSAAAIYEDVDSGTFRSAFASKVIYTVPDILKKADIIVPEDLFYDTALYLDREDDQLYLKKGKAVEITGDFKEAKLNYTKAILLNAENYEAKYRLSRIYAAEGNKGKALELLNDIRSHSPGFTEALYEEAKLLSDNGEFDRAEKDINLYLANNPDKIEAYRLKASILKGLGNLEGIVDVYEKAIETDHSNPLFYKERADALLAIDKLNEASFDIEVALKLAPGDPEGYLVKGRILLELNDFKASAENFKKALELKPEYPEAKVFLEKAMIKAGQKNAAGTELEEIINENKDNSGLHYTYAGILSETGQFDKAIQEIDKAFALDKNRFEFYSLKCEILLKKGESLTAEKLIKDAERLNADDDYLYFVKGRYYLSLRNYSSALEAFNKAIDRNPYFVRAYAGKTVALSFTGKIEEAEEALYSAMSMNQNDYYCLYAKASVSFAQKRMDSALLLLNEAMKSGGKDVSLLELMNMIEKAVN